MNYVVYDNSGKILRHGQCPEALMPMQAQRGEHVIEDVADDRIHKIVGGQVVDKTPTEIEADNPTPPPVPEDEKQKHIKKKNWDAIQAELQSLSERITALEP